MAFTAKIGTVDSTPGNIVPGLGANPLAYHLFSGLYTLKTGKTNDTLFLSINYPSYITIDVAIPNPYIETGLLGDEAVKSPYSIDEL